MTIGCPRTDITKAPFRGFSRFTAIVTSSRRDFTPFDIAKATRPNTPQDRQASIVTSTLEDVAAGFVTVGFTAFLPAMEILCDLLKTTL